MVDVTNETICAVATPAGAGAIGVLRLSGPRAFALLARCIEKPPAPRRAALRDLRDPDSGDVLDQVLVLRFAAPGSYTGEDVVELHGHGGVLNMAALERLFLRLGARMAEPGEFTRRAFLNGKLDLVQAEAVSRVIDARSERALKNAQGLLAGALGRQIAALRELALSLAADLEACIDFADEQDAAVAPGQLQQQAEALVGQLAELVGSYDRRGALDGVDVALVGPVNVGKSSLLNALLGAKRALVSTEAGTTRDYLEVQQSWDGLAVTLVDTAGQRRTSEMSELERAGHELGETRVARCDLSLQLFDATAGKAALREAAQLPDRLLVGNKRDLIGGPQCEALEREAEALGRKLVLISALAGDGLDRLKAAVVAHVLPEEGGAGFRITERRQYEGLRRAQQAAELAQQALVAQTVPEIVVEHVRELLGRLGDLLGLEYSEQVLDLIFSRFCIGK